MSKYEICYEKDNEILNTIKGVILKYYPVLENRLDVLFSYPSPTLDIYINFNNYDNKNHTQFTFGVGSEVLNCGTPDSIMVDGLVSSKVIVDLIGFILSDHDIISSINKTDKQINLSFKVNMKDENMCGIGCGEIKLNLEFYTYENHKELLDSYLNIIVTSFFDKLKNTESFKREYNDYCLMVKEKVINFLTEEQLHIFINMLNNEDLCEMLFNMPNDRFIEVYENFQNQKKLIK